MEFETEKVTQTKAEMIAFKLMKEVEKKWRKIRGYGELKTLLKEGGLAGMENW